MKQRLLNQAGATMMEYILITAIVILATFVAIKFAETGVGRRSNFAREELDCFQLRDPRDDNNTICKERETNKGNYGNPGNSSTSSASTSTSSGSTSSSGRD
ncbi:hypothetical protein JNK13_03710 [bacterium]|nr:hypothetical protein [bacterium]